ncbi:MAG: sensor histidine kinase [Flavobacteriales bacterium]|nr:sensor histidine kinase [Flavobacteriales bacterium]
MRKCTFYFLFISVLLFAPPSFAQNDFQNLKKIAQNKPKSLLSLFENDETPSLKIQEQTFLLSIAYQQLGDYAKADSLINYAFAEYSFEQDSGLYINYLMLLSNQRKIISDFESSLTPLFEAIEYCTKNKDTLNLVSVYIYLSETYRAIDKFDLGLEYLEKAEQLVEHYGEEFPQETRANLYNRKAAILIQQDADFDLISALSFKTIAIASQLGDKNLEASSYNALGFIYINKSPVNPDTIAKQYFLNAIQLWDDIGDDIHATNARLNLSRYYNRHQEYEKGLSTLLPIHEMVDNSDWIWEKGGYYEMLGRLYYGTEDHRLAFLYTDKAKEKRIQLSESQYDKRLALLSIKHNLQQQKKEVQFAKLETKNKEDENSLLYITLISVFTLAIIIFIFLIISLRQKRQLREHQNQLSQVVLQKESLLKEVNHRVNNNLTILSSLLRLQSGSVKSKEAKESLQDSQLRIQSISLIHKSLYQDNNDQLNFNIYLKNLFSSIQGLYRVNTIAVRLNISVKEYEPNLKESVPVGMILNELMTNSFKYAFHSVEEPAIFISATTNSIRYHDNGPGFETNQNSSSLGLKLISIFAIQLDAKVSYQKIDQMTQTTIEWT